jgi:hypothetical protein
VRARLRRLGAALVVIGGVASVIAAGPAEAMAPAGPATAAACTGERVVSISGSRVVEGSARGGFTTLRFTVTSTGCAQAGSVRFSTTPWSATKEDFVATTASVSYRAGETAARTVPVQVVPDFLPEPVHCFFGSVQAPTAHVRIAAAQAVGTILDDDRAGAGTARGFMCSE